LSCDLHCHSSASDGTLDASELVARAIGHGVTTLSLTDHDTLDAYTDSRITRHSSIRIIPGIELSCQWRHSGIHVVGLGIDPASTSLNEGCAMQQATRHHRALRIAERLEAMGLRDSLSGAMEVAGNAAPGRAHFATSLVNRGQVANYRQAFRKYLGDGKAGDIKNLWPEMSTVIDWIRDAGGLAIIAHPARYGFTTTRLGKLLDEFKHAGGRGMEVVSGIQQADVTARLARLCVDKGLLASWGSDFHRPGQPWADIGRFSALPSNCPTILGEWDG
jgi:3',5'-nucleoside bisphosphate phosphatase